jgi:hypothetical protein|tara:strand:+ start:2532 stop:2690 length:159 start_codon:yes stop_codon:yes gene_type:complete
LIAITEKKKGLSASCIGISANAGAQFRLHIENVYDAEKLIKRHYCATAALPA